MEMEREEVQTKPWPANRSQMELSLAESQPRRLEFWGSQEAWTFYALVHFACLLRRPLTHFQWCSVWKYQPASALLKGTRNQDASPGLSVQGAAAPPRGPRWGSRSAELGKGSCPSLNRHLMMYEVQVRSGRRGEWERTRSWGTSDLGFQQAYMLPLLPLYFLSAQVIKIKECPSPNTHLEIEEYGF